jgi:hypothetical protein
MIRSFIKEKLIRSFMLNLFILLEVYIWIKYELFNHLWLSASINLIVVITILFVHHAFEVNGKKRNG